MRGRVEGAAHTSHSEPSTDSSSTAGLLRGRVRNTSELAVCCYSGHEIERVPVKIGDVRVPFVVNTCMFP